MFYFKDLQFCWRGTLDWLYILFIEKTPYPVSSSADVPKGFTCQTSWESPRADISSWRKIYKLMLRLLQCREATRGSLAHLYKLKGFFTRQAILSRCRPFFFSFNVHKSFQWCRMTEGPLIWSIKSIKQGESSTKRRRFYCDIRLTCDVKFSLNGETACFLLALQMGAFGAETTIVARFPSGPWTAQQ